MNETSFAAGAGDGWLDQHRMYQLVPKQGPVVDRMFEIGFLDRGVEAFAFAFG